MNRIEYVLTKIGYTVPNIISISETCPGTHVKGLPKSSRCSIAKNLDPDICRKCWEEEVK